jgi:hypothetical protein
MFVDCCKSNNELAVSLSFFFAVVLSCLRMYRDISGDRGFSLVDEFSLVGVGNMAAVGTQSGWSF